MTSASTDTQDSLDTPSAIMSLGREKDWVGISNILRGFDKKQTKELILADQQSTENSNNGGGSSLAMFVLKGASVAAESGLKSDEAIIGTIVSAFVDRICSDGIESKGDDSDNDSQWTSVSDKLLDTLTLLSPRAIIDCAFRILTCIKSNGAIPGSLVNFLPMLLDALGHVGAVNIIAHGTEVNTQASKSSSSESETSWSGIALKAYWIDSVCSYRWAQRSSVSIGAVLREIMLEESQITQITTRLLRQLKIVDMNELPAMVYQLLLLSRKGSKKSVISGVFEFFDNLEITIQQSDTEDHNNKWRELGDIEGTVMLHIMFSIKQDLDLGDELIGYIKSRELVNSKGSSGGDLSTFSYACLLSLARIHRFEETVMTFLRTSIIKNINDSFMRLHTTWIRPYLPISGSSTHRLFELIISRSSFGWDQVTQSFVRLCLDIIDYTSAAARRTSYDPKACYEARNLCINGLKAAFSVHKFVRSELVGQILHRVTFQSDSHIYFLDLLEQLIKDDIDAFESYNSRLVDMFDTISYLPKYTAQRFLEAISPIYLEDAQLRGSLILALRKILFAHNIDNRKSALAALFTLIHQFASALSSCNRNMLDDTDNDKKMHRRNQAKNELLSSILLELFGLLRRCLTQQPEIRLSAYTGISSLINASYIRDNTFVLNSINLMLRVEFNRLYNADHDYDSPISINQCINPTTYKVVIPAAEFLQCFARVSWILIKQSRNSSMNTNIHTSNSSSSVSSLASLANIWKDMCIRFEKCEMEDFELDPGGNYSLGDPVGLRNHNTARVVVGCLNSVLEYALLHCIYFEPNGDSGSNDLDNPEFPLKIFSKFARFADILCSRCVDDKKRRVIGSFSELSSISLETILDVLEVTLHDRVRLLDGSHSLNVKSEYEYSLFSDRVLRFKKWTESQPFIKYLLETAITRVQKLPNATTNWLQPTNAMHLVLRAAYIAYSGVVSYYNIGSDDSVDPPTYLRAKSAKGKSILNLCTDLLLTCTKAIEGSASPQLLPALACATTQPIPALFEPGTWNKGDDGSYTIHTTQTTSISNESATVNILAFVSRLMRCTDTLIIQKPVAIKETANVLSVILLLAKYLKDDIAGSNTPAELANAQLNSRVYRCLKKVAEWSHKLLQSCIPADINILRTLFGVLLTCQPFLQPESLMLITTDRNSSDQIPPPPATRESDNAEFNPIYTSAERASRASRIIMGIEDSSDDDDDGMVDGGNDLFTVRTLSVFVGLITTWIKSELHSTDWAIGQLKRVAQSELIQESKEDSSNDNDCSLELSIHTERRICYRICSIGDIVAQLLSGSLSLDSTNLVLKSFQDLQKTFSLLTRTKISVLALPITEAYIDSLSLICSDLNSDIYSVIIDKYSNIANLGADNSSGFSNGKDKKYGIKGKGKNAASSSRMRSRVLRESTLVPSIIYQIELSEKYVIQLSTKFKTPLAHYLRRSTARDFRINISNLPTLEDIEQQRHAINDEINVQQASSSHERRNNPEGTINIQSNAPASTDGDDNEDNSHASGGEGALVVISNPTMESNDESEVLDIAVSDCSEDEDSCDTSVKSDKDEETMDDILNCSPQYNSDDDRDDDDDGNDNGDKRKYGKILSPGKKSQKRKKQCIV